ncbi:MAG TPA: DUF2332 domain-containing protein [Thermomicrobiales bacterium]|nr:DUF2332 domain-containing protein [Thermomicrobiales bacterium]
MEATYPPELAAVARWFAEERDFDSSPLYRALARMVAGNERLLRLAARGRPGQVPTVLFFAAVHALLLAGAEHELARYYPSIVGDGALPPGGAGPALVAFCAAHESELAALTEMRLVQTNVVKRALALRLGLAAVGRRVGAPVHLVEIGASAGLLLRCDRYGYTLGGRHFGDPRSPVQLEAEWRGGTAVPDLDAPPPLASATGVDLNPLDARDPADRRWLEALVWPENRYETDLLHRALAVVAADPPPIRAGDAIDVCPALAADLPPGEPRVAFHTMTRLHVPADRLAAFDAAIDALGRAAPLYRLSLEGRGALDLRDPSGALTHLAACAGRIEWIEPRDL